MIKFFRKIRQKLLTENKFSKYLIYAIGEIVLVVIGILIALQINNWNQSRINTQKEINHLKNILKNLNDDLVYQISPCIERTEIQIQAFELLETGLYTKKDISNDSIRQLFFQMLGQWDLILNTVAFENLKSSGMDILSNDSIKLELLTLYGKSYQYVKSLQDYYDQTHDERVSSWFFNNNVDMWERLTDQDKQKIISDKRLYGALKSEARYTLKKYLSELKKVKPTIQKLIAHIKEDIKRLEEK